MPIYQGVSISWQQPAASLQTLLQAENPCERRDEMIRFFFFYYFCRLQAVPPGMCFPVLSVR
jgi:hypothetical protein